ncbi:HEPN domain-containing protein [Bradyrhizobium sp. 26S5]|uniref:HEPN domain-containing protein n=1 Tax=Bradyrhizobium sp. 26S5 TaxID=3139729 RepID=UPI0030CABEE1
MSIDLDELYPYSLVDEFFIKTADDNYVNARWCFEYGLDVDFFWLAAHCIEKYLKAALLLNGRSAKRYGHDITALYPEVQSLAPELLPVRVETPVGLEEGLFGLGSEPVEEFVRRVYLYGQPDNRYQMIGYIKREADILKLDQLVFAVRRLCQPLESHFLGQQHKGKAGFPDETRRERMLRDDPSSRNLYSNLEKVISGERGKLLRRIALNWNFSFAPPDFKHGRIRLGYRMVNPVTVLRFLDPLDKGTVEQDKHADELWEWATENIYFPSEFRKLYEAERKRRKEKAKETRKS